MELNTLQEYWWLLISVLGALLVFMLFVQGGQTFLPGIPDTSTDKSRLLAATGHKWELTFTTLVVFGGAFFASFPLYYSTSFGGAYWLWMLILISFVLQAVSYEFRSRPGNIFGSRTYDIFLLINGSVGCVLLGVAVAMMFFGAEFTVERGALTSTGSLVISRWASSHGWEVIFDARCLCLGFAVLFLARTQAALYLLNLYPVQDTFRQANRRRFKINSVIFVVFYLAFLALLLTTPGYITTYDAGLDGGVSFFEKTDSRYLLNYIEMPAALGALLAGTLMVLYAIGKSWISTGFNKGIWWSGAGTVLVVLSLFWVAGYNDTPYLPSTTSAGSSLTIYNSSSSYFTLKVMAWVSLIIPIVLGYIIVAWRKIR